MRRYLLYALALVALLTVVALVVHLAQHWLAVHTGTVNESGPYYGFWSGFGSDLGELTLIGAITAPAVAAFKHHNCHEKGCWRLGRPLPGTTVLACHKHHPLIGRSTRNGSVEDLYQRHVQGDVSEALGALEDESPPPASSQEPG